MKTASKTSEKVQPQENQESAAQWVALDRVHAWPKNPHPPQPKEVRNVARSVKRFGFGAPLVARLANGELIAGHVRLLAAKLLKLQTVPVRFLDLPEDEAHVLALADNKLASNRERDWEDDAVSEILDDLEERGIELAIGTGFDDEEIDKILGGGSELEDEAAAREGAGGAGGNEAMPDQWAIVVQCRDEAHQLAMLERLGGEGLECRALVG
jgi:hypothetical protein